MKIQSLLSLMTVLLLLSCSSEKKSAIDNANPDLADSTTIDKSIITDDIFAVQDLFKPENSDVVNTIAQENFELAVEKARTYLSDDQLKLTEIQKANLRYMHIYALAGLVTQNKKTHADMEELLSKYKGADIITQHLEITKGNRMPFNQIQVEQDKEGEISVTCANNDGFNIHCFVRVEMKETIDLKQHIGKSAYLCGTLKDFKLSDERVVSWIVDMNLSDGEIKILEDEFK